jgi:hypothetical protein
LGASAAVEAQVRPDSIPPDSLALRDSLSVPDSLALADTLGLGQEADSTAVDSIFYNLPDLDAEVGEGWGPGVWVWDQEEIMATGAATLAELVAEVPGVVTLMAGDYGTPLAITAFGVGGGRIRLIRDGFEVFPLEGGVADLDRVGLVGIERVRLLRAMGELVIELTSLRHREARPYSLIEAGNGDLDTNMLRGAFANPDALGGSVAVAIERSDSRGARGDEPGNRTGAWMRYQLHRGNDAGLALDFRRMASETEASVYASTVRRTDLAVRGRARLAEGLTGEAYWGRSVHRVEDERERYEREGGTRSQIGLRTAWSGRGFSATGAYRRYGEDFPGSRLDLALGGERPEAGGFAVELGRAAWPDVSTGAKRIRAWTRPVGGLSLFGSWESGTYGSRTGPLLDIEPTLPDDSLGVQEPDSVVTDSLSAPLFHVTDRTASRLGAQFRWKDAVVSGAMLRLEADSLLPLAIEPDREGSVLAGGERTGWEVWGRVPTPLDGLYVEGSLQQWDEAWSYMPKRIYHGAFAYHKTFLESGNFELWWALGVRGRDPMTVRQVLPEAEGEEGEGPLPQLPSVPFSQSWYLRLQMRIVSLRVFVVWENFTVRRNLQDFPDRLLPITRAVYGLRWTMWN